MLVECLDEELGLPDRDCSVRNVADPTLPANARCKPLSLYSRSCACWQRVPGDDSGPTDLIV